MKGRRAVLLLALAACGADSPPPVARLDAHPAPPGSSAVPAETADSLRPHPSPAATSVCLRFARRVAEAAKHHPRDAPAFLHDLQAEFVGGTDDPFALDEGLREGRWNQRYFYAGDGGFREPYDDNRPAYRRGGNHQPGHFVSVLSIAATLGAEQARLAIAYAGDYDPKEADDLRLSRDAIRLGAGLTAGSVTPARVAAAARGFCR